MAKVNIDYKYFSYKKHKHSGPNVPLYGKKINLYVSRLLPKLIAQLPWTP